MKKTAHRIFFTALLFLNTSALVTGDMGFRYKDGKCLNQQGQEGLNKGYFGQCSDLRGVVLGRFELDGIDFSGSQFTGSDLQLSTLNKTILVNVNFEGANLSGVEFAYAKIQNSKFKKAFLKNVVFNEANIAQTDFSESDFSKGLLSYFNCDACSFKNTKFIETTLDGAVLTNSDFSNADFSGANLEDANLSKSYGEKVKFNSVNFINANLTQTIFKSTSFKKARLKNSKISDSNFELSDISGADLSNVNLDGVNLNKVLFNQKTILIINKDQAQELGMIFKKAATILILWDQQSEPFKALVKALEKDGSSVTIYQKNNYEFDGKGLSDFTTVIYFNGMTYQNNMNPEGQKALVKFVRGGGTFIASEWSSYSVDAIKILQDMTDLILFVYSSGATSDTALVPLAEKRTHPILEGISDIPVFSVGHSIGGTRKFLREPSEVLMKDTNGNEAVAVRHFGEGNIVSLYFTCAYNQDTCLADEKLQRLYINAVNFGL